MTCEGVEQTDMTLGKLIRRLRRQKHLSQTALAQAAGIDPQTISNLEVGRTNSLRGEGYRRIAETLGKTVEEMDQMLAAEAATSIKDETIVEAEKLGNAAGITADEVIRRALDLYRHHQQQQQKPPADKPNRMIDPPAKRRVRYVDE
jgi:transcriptional regulator with XRE-family HTH domain